MASIKSTTTGSSKSVGTQRVSKVSSTHDIRAGQISVSASGVNATNVKAAIEEISSKAITASASAPTSDLFEGQLWYDSDDDKAYIRDEDSWQEIHVAGRSTLDGGTFT